MHKIDSREHLVAMKPKHAVAALLDQVKEANGWSDEDIAAQARRHGHALAKSTVSELRNNPIVGLKASMIRALAAGMQLDDATVAVAFLTAMGIRMKDRAGTVEDAIRADPSLSDRERHQVLALLTSMRH